MDRRPSVPSTEGSLSPAPSHDNLLAVSASTSRSAFDSSPLTPSGYMTRSHSNSPLMSPAPSLSRLNTGDISMGSGERDVASHVARYGQGEGYEQDYEQTPTQAGPSRYRDTQFGGAQREFTPARSLAYGAANGNAHVDTAKAKAIPSRHATCELCALVEQCRLEGASRSREWERRKIKGRDVVFADERITVYEAQGKERLIRPGKHIILVVNIHAESVYQLGPVDVPLLSHISSTARTLLSASDADGAETGRASEDVQVGFVGMLVRDPMSAHTHLHAQAISGPIDTTAPGASFWRRNVVFAGVNWYGVDDLRAEIREETSNNRIKSGYEHRHQAPIDSVPSAGSVAGPASALDTRT